MFGTGKGVPEDDAGKVLLLRDEMEYGRFRSNVSRLLAINVLGKAVVGTGDGVLGGVGLSGNFPLTLRSDRAICVFLHLISFFFPLQSSSAIFSDINKQIISVIYWKFKKLLSYDISCLDPFWCKTGICICKLLIINAVD